MEQPPASTHKDLAEYLVRKLSELSQQLQSLADQVVSIANILKNDTWG